MKEYVISLLVTAAIITIIAVGAGTVVYLGAKYGTDNPVFRLSRIAIVWGMAILLLLLVGVYIALVTDWTVNSLRDFWAWFSDHSIFTKIWDLFVKYLDWSYSEHPWGGWAILWVGTFVPAAMLAQRQAFTQTACASIALLHCAISGYIWQGALAITIIEAIVFVIVFCICLCEGSFDEQYTWRQRRKIRQRSAEETAQATQPPEAPADHIDEPDHQHPVQVLGDIIADCAQALTETAHQ